MKIAEKLFAIGGKDKKSGRNEIEREQMDGQGFISSILDSISSPVAILDAQERVLRLNRACERVIGCSSKDVTGKRFEDLFPASSEVEGRKEFHGSESQQRSISDECENRWIEVEGSLRLLAWRRSAITDDEGAIEYVVKTGADVTDAWERAEEHRRLLTAVEQAAESFLILDSNRVIRYVSSAFEKLTGYTRDEIINSKIDLLKSEKQDNLFFKTIWQTVKRGEAWSGGIITKKKNGALVETDTVIAPVKDSTGNIKNYAVIKQEKSDAARLEKQLRQAQKMEALGVLAGGIAHDFNNILFPIIGYTEMALSEIQGGGSPMERNLGQVLKAAHRAKELVRQILAFSRRAEQEQAPVQISLIVKETLQFLRASLPSTIQIRHDIAPEAARGTVIADPTQIHQVLMNLCANAAHSMREKGGLLEVKLADVEVDAVLAHRHENLEPGCYLKLTVADTGHGMDRATMQHIFEPYFTTKEPGEGTGMGLAVIYGIVRSCHGVITVVSEPGVGSVFEIFLPLTNGARIDQAEKRDLPHKGHGRILFVDDDEIILDMGSQMLRRLGYEVTPRQSSIEALDTFRKDAETFRLVVTDQTMPHMTGSELVEELRRIRPDIPVILCTGFSDLINEEKAKAMGIQGFLMKPFVSKQVAGAIRDVLSEASQG